MVIFERKREKNIPLRFSAVRFEIKLFSFFAIIGREIFNI